VFTSRQEVWAVGESWPPPGGQGSGDRVLLHSSDGGQTWTEVPHTEHYAAAPSVTFLDAKTGWVRTYKGYLFEEVLLETRNAGKNWKDVTGKFPVFPRILDARHWWGVEMAPREHPADGRLWKRTILRTEDAGRSWQRSQVPDEAGDFPVLSFLSWDVGWATNVSGGGFQVFRTTDGGKTWDKTMTTPTKPPVGVTDICFIDKTRGWLLADYNLHEGLTGNGSYLFATIDGGKTWTLQETGALRDGPAFWMNFLSERLGLLAQEGALVYTVDLGAHWHRIEVPDLVTGCQAFEADVLCGGLNLAVLTMHPK